MNRHALEPPFPKALQPARAARPPGYPAELERSWALRDGRSAFARPIVPADELMIERQWRQADAETLYQRFFTAQPKLDARRLHSLVHVDYRWRLALAAFAGDGQGIGVARYEGKPRADQAEIALVVHQDWRRAGLASALLGLLIEAARARDIRRLTALCLQDNQAMTGLLDRFGFERPTADAGIATATKTL
ncbi:MAG TPA: GNAT family N-acetyltransferase [Candidatus Competibacter sp.]|nr:cyclic nucleotide-binding protein [Candidatus Competibacteraceae bacterium]HRE54263.1 GNAT family N-acetyltransferase [Candidatus Competibacter sp.]HUM94205.1 GNAT family N-acetyltransferase [Candidatus Competibacter sp.]